MGLKMADCCKLFGKDYPEDLDDFIDFFCTQWSQRKNTIKAALASGKPSDWLLMCRQAESPDFIEKEGHPLQQQCRELLAKDPMKYKKCIHTIRNVARARMREEKKKNHTVPPHQQHTVSPNRTGSLHRTMSPNHTVLSSQDYVLQEDLHVTSPLETWVIVASDKGVLVFPLQRNDVQSNAEATFLTTIPRLSSQRRKLVLKHTDTVQILQLAHQTPCASVAAVPLSMRPIRAKHTRNDLKFPQILSTQAPGSLPASSVIPKSFKQLAESHTSRLLSLVTYEFQYIKQVAMRNLCFKVCLRIILHPHFFLSSCKGAASLQNRDRLRRSRISSIQGRAT
ncbi:hypothetical protein HBH51_239130 [Parastagonospora nodorum]|nr:hypothetical protein HBH51_239130 [Parastagonospora nodorum]